MKTTRYTGYTILTGLLTLMLVAHASAEREPVLKQINVPHNYYFREMYLPQVSSGPQSPAWSPDGQSLVFTMQGSLWYQALDSTIATQLTAGPGYDHQPDWSPDGRSIVFTRYLDDAMELHLLDRATGAVQALTRGGDVNLEPRWSPDGARLAFVSTAGTGRFHVLTGTMVDGRLTASPLVDERRSQVERYYYSDYDHQISPAWSNDGSELLVVANPEVPYGSGSVWRLASDGSTEPALVRREETAWRARPDLAPDGRRIVYSSYLGRQWHQLWLTTIEGGAEPFPITYGDYDATSARWSPDGERIAYTVNEFGNTQLRILRLPGGQTTDLEIRERRYLRPTGSLSLEVMGEDHSPVAYRASVVGADGRAYAPQSSLAHADDNFDRSARSDEARYFHAMGEVGLNLPEGLATVTVWRGMEAKPQEQDVQIRADSNTRLAIELTPLKLPDRWLNWRTGDVHVHMNYGGIYRNTPENLIKQAQAEDLNMVFNLIVNKEQRVPDIHHFSGNADANSNSSVVLQHSQEFHTSYWGHVSLLGLTDNLLLPDYSAYPYTAAASLYPDNATVADLAHEQGAIVGYVHPFDYPLPDPVNDVAVTNALPIDAALGKVDFYEVVGFADHFASADIWYRLLNCGFRISAAGGTDAMANYASLRGPVGMNRTYVYADSWPDDANARRDVWIKNLKAGKSMATNGPLVGLTVNGESAGALLDFDGAQSVSYSGFLRSIVPVENLELVFNGKVVRSIELGDDSTSVEFEGELEVTESGWLLLRTYSREPHPHIFDMYPYATTSPIYINVDGEKTWSLEDAEYFAGWAKRVRASAASHPGYNSAEERQQVLQHIDAAIAVYTQP